MIMRADLANSPYRAAIIVKRKIRVARKAVKSFLTQQYAVSADAA